MNIIRASVERPITVAVAVILALLAGMVAFRNIPIRMAPEIESVVISVATAWENASAQEVESDVIEQQEKYLGEVPNLVSMASISRNGRGLVRLQFKTGTDIREALADVDRKLSEVPGYPLGVDQPTIEAIDPESVDYIGWVGLSSDDPNFDTTTLFDFMERRMKPVFKRIPGISQVGITGARASEIQVIVDPYALAARGLTYEALLNALQVNNANFSAGRIVDGKSDLRVRSIGRFENVDNVEELVLRRDEDGPVYVRDVAKVVAGYKERIDFARARGTLMPFFNFQLEPGGNLLDVMAELQAEIRRMNADGGLLSQQAKLLQLDELMAPGTKLELVQTSDSSTYVKDALALVQSNILTGGVLAITALLLFLRSIRSIGIIALAIPLSTIGTVVILLFMGRSVNIISLAGMAFAVGMVVDNAIVVIENIFRHLQTGCTAKQAAVRGSKEVAGAVLASTLTTLIVFLPILRIEEQAGQLFRDIALAIMAAVGLSLIVSLTVIPSAAGVILRKQQAVAVAPALDITKALPSNRRLLNLWNGIRKTAGQVAQVPVWIGSFVAWLIQSWGRRIVTTLLFVGITITGIWYLLPPLDYLPKGNRNLVFGLMVPPPAYSVDQLFEIGSRIEPTIAPSWEAAGDRFAIESVRRGGPNPMEDRRAMIPIASGSEEKVLAPLLDHYFLVAREGRIFQIGITKEPEMTPDALPLLEKATAGQTAPDTLFFCFQFPLFRTGGATGAAIKIDVVSDSLDDAVQSARVLMLDLIKEYGPRSTNPNPANFLLPTPEIQILPHDDRLQEAGLTRRDIGLATQAAGDGILIPRRFERGGELRDLKIINSTALGDFPLEKMLNTPIATRADGVVDLESLATVERVLTQDQIRHVDRQRAVTLEFTPPGDRPLGQVMEELKAKERELRTAGKIPATVDVRFAGSAGALAEIKQALIGDGTIVGTLSSSMFLAILIVYLLMVILFQSWAFPLVIMISVPLATFGGFIGLAIVHNWTLNDRYLPVQNMDVLTILGFVILAGVVVNNAILIVHQALNFLKHGVDENGNAVSKHPKDAIVMSVRTRVRPILMSTLTSVGGMLPLVFLRGPGSELYRGLGAVIIGGLVVSTVFTILLVPIVLSMVFSLFKVVEEEQQEGILQS